LEDISQLDVCKTGDRPVTAVHQSSKPSGSTSRSPTTNHTEATESKQDDSAEVFFQ
jgi:hypothetical protein